MCGPRPRVYVREMAASHVPPVVRAWHAMSAWIGPRIPGSSSTTTTWPSCGHSTATNALIFLISHRFLPGSVLLSATPYAGRHCADVRAGRRQPSISFPLGTLARRNGFIPVRRATGDMPAYRVALRAVVGRMVSDGRNLVVVDRRRPDTHRQTAATPIRVC